MADILTDTKYEILCLKADLAAERLRAEIAELSAALARGERTIELVIPKGRTVIERSDYGFASIGGGKTMPIDRKVTVTEAVEIYHFELVNVECRYDECTVYNHDVPVAELGVKSLTDAAAAAAAAAEARDEYEKEA
jgi:hypothetical protein